MEWLRLSKNTEGARYFETESGRPMNLFGMARCQNCCGTETKLYGDAGDVAAHFKNLKCNLIRLSIHVDGEPWERGGLPADDLVLLCGGYNTEGINKFIDTYVDPDVQLIKKQGMYIQLDLHDYPQSRVKGDDEIVRFATDYYIPVWRELAKRYKDDPQIAVFEIWNEPYPADVATAIKDSPEWVASIRKFFFEAVKAIREIDQKHIIMVSDYNAGWGKAWDICWKDYHKDLDEFNNTCFSIHLARQQLELEHPYYGEWLVETSAKNNVSFFFGEVETEDNLNSICGMKNLLKLLTENEATHHFPAVLWRPHGDKYNYVAEWREFAEKYTADTIEF